MGRIQQIILGEKTVLEVDLSFLRSNDEFKEVIDTAKRTIGAFSPRSVYALINVEGLLFDGDTKKIVMEWMTFNSPFIRHTAIVGADGIKKMMITSILKITNRRNVQMHSTREEAINWLAKRD